MPNKAEREAQKKQGRVYEPAIIHDSKKGETTNLFGGRGASDGPDHGDIRVNEAGETTFVRDTDVSS